MKSIFTAEAEEKSQLRVGVFTVTHLNVFAVVVGCLRLDQLQQDKDSKVVICSAVP